MAKLAWTRLALSDLEEIKAFIATESPKNARTVVARIRQAPKILRSFPESGSIVEDAEITGFREILVPPFRIIYRYESGTIIAVVRGKRDLRRALRFPQDPDAN